MFKIKRTKCLKPDELPDTDNYNVPPYSLSLLPALCKHIYVEVFIIHYQSQTSCLII